MVSRQLRPVQEAAVAAVAESHQTWALPHVWDHGLTLLCSLHAIGSVPNAPYAECTDDVNWPAAVPSILLDAMAVTLVPPGLDEDRRTVACAWWWIAAMARRINPRRAFCANWAHR